MSLPGSPNLRSRSREASQENLENDTDSSNLESSLHGNQTASGTPVTVRKRIGVDVRDSRERSVTPGPGAGAGDGPQQQPRSQGLGLGPSKTRSGAVYEPVNTDYYNQNQQTIPDPLPSGLPSGSASSSSQSRHGSNINANANTNKPNTSSIFDTIWDYINGNPYLKIALFIIILLVILMACSFAMGNFFLSVGSIGTNRPTPNIWKVKRSEFRSIFKEFQEKTFPHQPLETFTQIYALVEGSLKNVEPVQPSAVVVLIPPEMHQSPFPLCFIRKLASAINGIFEPKYAPRAKGLNLNHFTKTKNVTLLHEDLIDYFDGGGRAVVVEDVEKLDEESHLLVFHSFCDNSRAYQKRAIFFFLLPVPQNIFAYHEWDFRHGGQIADAVLDMAWTKVLTPDKRPALISRIAGSSVLLKSGDICG